MKQRIITGIIFAVLTLAVIFLSHTFIYPLVLTVLCVVGASEMLRCVKTFRNPFMAIPSMLYSGICPVLALQYRYGVLMAATMIYMFVMLMTLVYANERVQTEKVCVSFALVTYITFCFSCMIKLRYVTSTPGTNSGETIGKYIFLLVFIAAWITDTFAYCTGVFFGKHKLCPKISPKKTIEGSFGGVVFCVIAFVVYGLVVSKIYTIEPNFAGLALVGVVMSVLAQSGDLLASVIKRTYGVKDYGRLFPGHGGVLDRFDSVLLLAPFLLMLVEDAQFMQLLFRL